MTDQDNSSQATHANSLDFLNRDDYQVYNRNLARKLGSLNAAIFLSEIISRRKYHRSHNPEGMLNEGDVEWFYYTVDKAEERTVLSKKEQETAIKILMDRRLLLKSQKGMPAKRYFSLIDDEILNLFGLSKSISRTTEKGEQHKPGEQGIPKGENKESRKGRTGHKAHSNTLKNLREEPDLFVAKDPVGSPPSQIRVRTGHGKEEVVEQSDLYMRCSKHSDWSIESINYAWQTLADYKGIVYDWWAFIQGTVKKYKDSIISKRASGELVTKGSKHKPGTTKGGSCKTIQKENKNCKDNSSDKGSLAQRYPNLVCVGDLIKPEEVASGYRKILPRG